MKYIKRYNKFSFQTNCRICLTQSVSRMLALDGPLKGDRMKKPLVYEAMELVMSEKVNLSEKYPLAVCAVCAELLKISYDLKVQYCQSQKQLDEELGELSDNEADSEKSKEGEALVEILVGSEKFNIQDVFIVEEENENDEMFRGFLNNLGKTISASFVKKGYKKPRPVLEVPSLVIERVVQDQTNASGEINIESIESVYSRENVEDNAIADDDEEAVNDSEAAIDDNEEAIIDNDAEIPDNESDNADNEANDEIFIDTPVNDDIIKKFITSTENDKEALESAMNFKYKCPYCEKPMASLKKVKLHTSKTCKKNNSNARCYVCGVTFDFRKQLLVHLKRAHLVKIAKSQELREDKHKCQVCGKVFGSNGSLFYHMSKHMGKRHGCDKCDKQFYTRSQAANHRQTHNREDTLVVCPICGKGFHYQSGLFYHMKMHTNERNYQCSFCPRRFYTRNSLKRHELTHTGARPYACNFCDKKFRSLGEVKKHKLVHTGERPYQCNYCNAGFIQAHNLKVHLMTHPGNYQCKHCSRGFAEKEILRFHLRNKHGLSDNLQEDDFDQDEEDETTIPEEQDQDALEEREESIPEEFFIEYVNNEGQSIVQTYEVRDDVLVETIEDHL